MCTVDNNITLTFRFVSVPFLWNDSTVLRSVFRTFYGNEQRRTGASERNDLRDYGTIMRCQTASPALVVLDRIGKDVQHLREAAHSLFRAYGPLIPDNLPLLKKRGCENQPRGDT